MWLHEISFIDVYTIVHELAAKAADIVFCFILESRSTHTNTVFCLSGCYLTLIF